MKRNTFRGVIILAAISIVGISIIQIYWFRRAFDLEGQRFHREVTAALHEVAGKFFETSDAALPANNPIKQLSSNYYVVMINDEIDGNFLEYLLRTEFEKRDLKADFEYGIYDCTNDEMVYGSFISFTHEEALRESNLPKWENQSYYFGVNFPSRTSTIINRMGIWTFSSIILFVVIVFFTYTLFVIFRQKRLSEVQKDFINNMTHEFKTPISTIALSVGVLKDTSILSKPERLKTYAEIIENENNRMRSQVERVLQIASADKQPELSSEPVAIYKSIQEVARSLKLSIEKKQAEIEWLGEDSDCKVMGDPFHLNNVFYNLIDNSLKYAGNNTPHIQIEVIQGPKWCEVKIRDNGLGISRQDQKKVFQKFYRVSTGNVHNVKGFGLGLNYVREILKEMKSTIEVESELGKGSCFTVKIPVNHG